MTLLYLLDIAAVAVFALTGALVASRSQLDIVGFIFVACLTAVGGGTIRDVLLDRRPLFWVQNQEYVWLVVALTLTAPLLLRARRLQLMDTLMEVADACGLGLFAISGASVALVAGMPGIVAVLMGAITAVFGGVLRDVLCNEIPKVFHDHRPYTLCAFIGCTLFLALHALDVAPQLSTVAGICTITGLRLLAVARGWRIPAWPPDRQG